MIGTGLSVVMAMLFNLIGDLTGGVRVTVLEDEARPAPVPAAWPQRPAARFAGSVTPGL